MPLTPSPSSPAVTTPPPLPPIVLDYGSGRAIGARNRGDRALLLFSAAVLSLIGLAIVIGMIDVLVVTWPDFGYALIAVPVGLVAAAFLLVAGTAAKLAVQNVGDVEIPPEGSLARTRQWQG